jgi:hypothetical protein
LGRPGETGAENAGPPCLKSNRGEALARLHARRAAFGCRTILPRLIPVLHRTSLIHEPWAPTAASYFNHVSKVKILEAVTVVAPNEVSKLTNLKNGDLANEAEED